VKTAPAARATRNEYQARVLSHLDLAILEERPGQYVPFPGAGIYHLLNAVRLAVATCGDEDLFGLADAPMRAGVATFAPKPAAAKPKERPFQVIRGGARARAGAQR
jgi:hypothetical protein